MTSQATQYLALDVHQATVVASLRSADGSIRMRATVPTERTAIVNLVRGAGVHVHVALEEGTQAQWLHDVLAPVADRVVVCDTRGRSEIDRKSDQLDADRLSELLRLDAVTPVFHATQSAATLRELVHGYLNLVDDATNQVTDQSDLPRARYSHFRAVGVRPQGAGQMDRAAQLRRGSHSSQSPACGTGHPHQPSTAGEDGHGGRGAAAAGVEGAAIDPGPRSRSDLVSGGDHRDALPLPHQTAAVAVITICLYRFDRSTESRYEPATDCTAHP